jgi:citrate/tricarballylate utilization protein
VPPVADAKRDSAQHQDPIAEGQRQMGICNACRYCEGYCAVFPAMERRLNFSEADMNYLANLCHNCAECYYACQYAPPHEFAVNIPKVLAEIRAQSYRKYAWPRAISVGAPWAAAVGLVIVAIVAGARRGGDANFYGVIPHDTMVAMFGAVFGFIIIVHGAGFLRFWRESGQGLARFFTSSALLKGLRDGFSLKNLDSHGTGCTYPDEGHSQARRWFHHLTFHGFLLCAASTSIAAVYHSFFGWPAPYAYSSIPVVLGTLGGIGLLIGPVGLYSLKRRRDVAIVDVKQDRNDVSFIVLLFLTSMTGLLLLALRDTAAMGLLLRIHLGVVLGLCVTLPYGKYVHSIYRLAALVRSALETSRG